MMMPNSNANAEFIIDDGACDYLALVVTMTMMTMMIVLVGFVLWSSM